MRRRHFVLGIGSTLLALPGVAGALMSYGADQVQMCIDTVTYADKILKGAKPGELPVQQPTKLQLFINRKVAKALGLTIPPTLLATADELVE
jgi:putative tryptophan/tyrosine transport system substrate-binding protein